jgi:hypothetical protein
MSDIVDMPVTAATSTRTLLVEVMTAEAILVRPNLAKPCNFSGFLFMTHNAFANLFIIMTLMIEYNIMFKADDIFCKCVLA